MREIERFVIGQTLAILRHHHFELVATRDDQLGIGLRAHAHPIDAFGNDLRAVGFHSNAKTLGMQRVDERRVELEQRLPARAHDEPMRAILLRPQCHDLRDELGRRAVLAAVLAVGADEVGVAELADGLGTVLFTPRPQVAPCKPAEHGRTTGVRALALQCVEDFLYRVRHDSLDF